VVKSVFICYCFCYVRERVGSVEGRRVDEETGASRVDGVCELRLGGLERLPRWKYQWLNVEGMRY
jgi:hypothetical protein